MVSALVFALATGMGLLTDKYMLGVTNFVDHLSEMQATEFEKAFVKAAMYGGAVLGMMVFGPLSDHVGRRVCLIACSGITLIGAIGSAAALNEQMLIAARIITGIGMGGEYPLAASHSAESSSDSGHGGRNVGLLYLFGSGFGQAACPLVVYALLSAGLSNEVVWRSTFGLGALFALFGLVLRVATTQDSDKFKEAAAKRKETHETAMHALSYYAKPLLGTAFSWFFFDIVEYGLKQNDAAIFTASTDNYKDSVLTVFMTRLLVIPSLVVAANLPLIMATKWVQLIGFTACAVVNIILALYYPVLHEGHTVLFDGLYIIQLSFQSLPGVTTMAIPAEIFPSAFRGTGHGISAASGKVGAALGSYFFAYLNEHDRIRSIFWTVVTTALLASLVTLFLIPSYNGQTIDEMEALAMSGEEDAAVKLLYAGPILDDDDDDEEEEEEDDDDSGEDENGK
eukprot:CAMPEP_0180615698 /NCGR_PEP_ID=MMETSP1037_2-20121125/32082_1 /TAXON_ID=632150 /ORGANISM="Azadinium spinosum, Strain 3D9" /LENGTH=453 /DNA_ID=CAMNT_0022635481 /DNA_START=36 /DNA_END=1397 /DNA_ORIENTATION=+